MKRILQLLALVCSPTLAFGQGGNIGSNSTPVVNSLGRPLPGVSVSICQPLATTAASVTSNVATLTMASNPATAGFVTGMSILVSGFAGGDTYFNGGTFTNGTGITGGFTILSVTSTTITYALSHANASATSNGTALQQGNSTTSCAGLSTIASDPALVNTLTQPLISDGSGNWNAFVAANGTYYAQFYGAGATTKLLQYAVAPSTSGTNVFTGSNTFPSPIINGTPTGTGIPTVTLKAGAGASTYTGTNTSYADVDGTNLAYTVTIPTGWKLGITASADAFSSTAAANISVSLFDTQGSATLREEVTNPALGTSAGISLEAMIAGDGNSHTIKLQAKTANGADAWNLRQGSATFGPTMLFILSPSN